MVQTIDPRKILQPEFIEGIVNKRMEQQLDFMDMFPVVRTDALSFSYFKDTTNAGADITSGQMGTPNQLGEISGLDTIEVSRISQAHGEMERFGYKLEFSQRQLREPDFIDEVKRAMDRAAFGMAKKMNDDIVDAMKANVNDVTEVAGAAVWSADEAVPTVDMLSFRAASEVEGYPYSLSDLYVHKDNYYEALKAIQSTDIAWVQNPIGGLPAMPQLNGVNLHNLHSTQLAEGGYLGVDKNYPGLTVYQYNDPKHSTLEGGFVNVNQYEEERFPFNICVELYAERGLALKLPNAIYYRSAGI